jgi:aminoglycoside phosphotransferase (APT) family kinase protein
VRAVSTQATEGIDASRVTDWFEEHLDGVRPPLSFELISGGRSNLTYTVTDAADRRWVLRRPPLGHVLATAHDMGREYAVISALGPTDVPVPPAVGLCNDDSVNGAPFYVMGYVDGHVTRDRRTVEAVFRPERRGTLGAEVVDVLASIHAVEPDAVGLGELGRKDGYIARQLRRWHRQWEQSKTRELPVIDEVHAWLSEHVPDQGPATIVHGDYRLDNCMFDESGRMVAVLDWELCTLGDPLADVGLLMVYWSEPGDEMSALLDAPTAAGGFPGRAELLERYGTASGRDLSVIDYYVAFGYWKLACILEGVYARYAGGAYGREAAGFEEFGAHVPRLAEAAETAAERLG